MAIQANVCTFSYEKTNSSIMKNKNLLCAFLMLVVYTSAQSQALIAGQNIAIVDSNFRQANAIVLGSIPMNIPTAGKVVVRFDGTCLADSGDRIVLAASNSTSWNVNSGSVGIEVAAAASGRRSFSHTQVYSVSAGSQTFYAVGQNYVNEGGSGYATVYGTLTAEFFPNSGGIMVADTTIDFSGYVRPASTAMTQVTINAPTAGTVLVHIDGQVYSTWGDDIVLAAGTSTSWGVNNGNVTVQAASNSIDISPYSYTSSYTVSAGPTIFYADVQNYADTQGTGNATVYGTLTAEFFPNNGAISANLSTINQTRINVRQTPALELAEINVNADSAGVVLVRFDGSLYSDLGDEIFLAASDSDGWAPGSGSVTEIAWAPGNLDTAGNCFSHSRLYPVSAGEQTLYAVIQNAVLTGGTGMVSVYGSLSAVFYPGSDVVEAVQSVPANTNDFRIFPNPAYGQITIARDFVADANGIVQLTDISGKIIAVMNAGSALNVNLNISGLAPGIYLVKVDNTVKKFIRL